MESQKQVWAGLYTFCMSLLQTMYTAFYVDSYVRSYLSSPPVNSTGVLNEISTVTTKTPAGRNAHQRESPPASSPSLTLSESSPWKALFFLCVAQLAYTIVSCLSDAGFGCFGASRLRGIALRQLHRLTICGALLALCFTLLWVRPRIPLLHPAFMFTLFMSLYDGLHARCGNAVGKLLRSGGSDAGTAWLSLWELERGSLKTVSWSIAGGIAVVVASVLYENAPEWGMGYFRWTMLLCGLLAGSGLFTAGAAFDADGKAALTQTGSSPMRGLGASPSNNTSFSGRNPNPRRGEIFSGGSGSIEPTARSQAQRLRRFAEQTLGRPSMKALLDTCVLQAFSCTVTTNLFSLFLTVVCGRSMAPSVRACVLMMSCVAPPALALALSALYTTVGKKQVISLLFFLRLCVGVAAVVLAMAASRASGQLLAEGSAVHRPHPQADPLLPHSSNATPSTAVSSTMAGSMTWIHSTASVVFGALLFANRVLAETVTYLENTILKDVCDEDTIIFGRARPMSAVIGSLLTAVMKPARTLGLLLTCTFLVAANSMPYGAFTADGVPADKAAQLIGFVGGHTIVTAGAMLTLWHRQYNLEKKHLQFIQMAMRKRSEDQQVEQV